MKYKVGDKVRVKENLVVGSRYGNNTFVSNMKPYVGKIMTIDDIRDTRFYVFKGDPNKWYWTDEMLEDAESISIFVKGNKVIAKKDDKMGIAKCSPEDEFDIFVGAELALKRLEEKCNPYSWLKEGMSYYRPDINTDAMYLYTNYYNDTSDKRLMNRGLIFKTKEEAIECAKKMLEVVK